MAEIGTLQQARQGGIRIIGVRGGAVGMMQAPRNVVIHTDGLPRGGAAGDLLSKRSDADRDAEWITPAASAQADNTRPITSAAVYTEIGNINALLAII